MNGLKLLLCSSIIANLGLFYVDQSIGFASLFGSMSFASIAGYYLYDIWNSGKLPEKYKGHPVPPGPEGKPIVGHLFTHFTQPDLHKRLEKLGEEYGDIIQLRFGGHPAFVVRSMPLVHELFVENSATVIRTDYEDTRYAFNRDKDILISNGEPWKINRGAFHRAMSSMHSIRLIDEISQDEANKLVISLADGSPFIVSDKFIDLTFNTLIRAMLGRVATPEEKAVIVKLQTEFPKPCLSEIMPKVPFLDKVFETRHEQVRKMVDEINVILDDWVENPVGTDCMLYRLRKFDKVDIQSRRGMIFDMFVAGYDSVKYHMTWFLHLITMYPDVQRRLRTLLGKSQEEYDKYYEMVSKEVFRYRPIMLSGIWYKNTQDIVLNSGYIIPEGSFLFYDTWAIHHNKLFWKDPEVFNPDRFAEGGVSQADFEKNYIGFFIGGRSCLGKKMSHIQIKTVITTLLKHYEFVSDIPMNDHTFVRTIMAQDPFYLRPIKNPL